MAILRVINDHKIDKFMIETNVDVPDFDIESDVKNKFIVWISQIATNIQEKYISAEFNDSDTYTIYSRK